MMSGRGAAAAALAAPLALLATSLVAPTIQSSWSEIASEAVRVRFIPDDSLRAERALSFLLNQPRMPALPPGLPLEAVLYLAPDEATFAELTGGRIPDWGAGVAMPDQNVIVVPAYASRRSAPGAGNAVLRHEWAHLALHSHLEGLRVPRWFDEGYALWAEGGFDASEAWRLRILLALGRAPPLDSLTLEWPRDRASAEAAYLLSGSALDYLMQESGERGVRLFLERWREGGSFDAALAGTYGVTSGQLEDDWRAWVRRRFGWLLVLSHSVVLWTSLGLLLMLATLARRRWNRERMAKLRAGDPAERPAYWVEEGTDDSGATS